MQPLSRHDHLKKRCLCITVSSAALQLENTTFENLNLEQMPNLRQIASWHVTPPSHGHDVAPCAVLSVRWNDAILEMLRREKHVQSHITCKFTLDNSQRVCKEHIAKDLPMMFGQQLVHDV